MSVFFFLFLKISSVCFFFLFFCRFFSLLFVFFCCFFDFFFFLFLAAEAPQTFNNKHRGGVGERELGSQMGPWPDTKAGTPEESQLNLKSGFAILGSDWAHCRVGERVRGLPWAPAFGFCWNFLLQRMKTRGTEVPDRSQGWGLG